MSHRRPDRCPAGFCTKDILWESSRRLVFSRQNRAICFLTDCLKSGEAAWVFSRMNPMRQAPALELAFCEQSVLQRSSISFRRQSAVPLGIEVRRSQPFTRLRRVLSAPGVGPSNWAGRQAAGAESAGLPGPPEIASPGGQAVADAASGSRRKHGKGPTSGRDEPLSHGRAARRCKSHRRCLCHVEGPSAGNRIA